MSLIQMPLASCARLKVKALKTSSVNNISGVNADAPVSVEKVQSCDAQGLEFFVWSFGSGIYGAWLSGGASRWGQFSQVAERTLYRRV